MVRLSQTAKRTSAPETTTCQGNYPLTNQVAFSSTDFDLLTALGSIPVRILGLKHIPIFLLAVILLRSEATNGLEMLFMEVLRAFQNNEASILGSTGCQVRDALVQLKVLGSSWILVDIWGTESVGYLENSHSAVMACHLRGQASTGLMSVRPVFSLTGCEMLIPSKEAIRSLSPHA